MTNNYLFRDFKGKLIAHGFTGDIFDDLANRVINATDNSIYEVMPLGIIQPKNEQDVELLCQVANCIEFKQLTFTARGGGTGTNGQSLSQGVIVDMSRYMINILHFDVLQKTITVEPGIVLSQLNKFLHDYGLFFAPNVSTENRATIGGMIANDSAGKGSLIYGKTSDYVLELSCVLIDGGKLDIKNLTIEQLAAETNCGSQLGSLNKQILDLIYPVQEEINNRFLPLKRPLSGYNLKSFYDGHNIDLAKIITGSEGTLAFITKAKLRLLPIPKHKALLITHYNSFLDALADADYLIQHKPLAIETVDEVVQKSAATLPSWPSLAALMGISVTENLISNFIEFVDDNLVALQDKVMHLENALKERGSRCKVVYNENEIKQLWSIRSLAVGLVGRLPGDRKPIAFVEDAIVPPQNLRAFVADFRQLLDSYGLNYAMYGHSDVGCVHVRPALDMRLSNDRIMIRTITEQVIKLTDKYQGLLWGEHGKGYRGEFVERTFGDILYPVLQKIKALFDPHNRLNPGKLVTSYNSNLSVTRIDKVVMRGQLDSKIDTLLAGEFSESMLCNGNAACFNHDASNVMCPSYKVTQDRIHSPKGRAMLVKDWLRKKSSLGGMAHDTIESANAAFVALQGCLGCKGCSGKCPTQVSIPDLKAKFYFEYYDKYKKYSIKDIILANLEKILIIGTRFPKLWNFVVKHRLYPAFGMVNVPHMSLSKCLKTELKKHDITIYDGKLSSVMQLKKPVMILLDAFIGALNHQVLLATCEVLKTLGYVPVVIYPKVSGKALIGAGKLGKFRVVMQSLCNELQPIFKQQIPIVGLENSITLMYRDEYKKFGNGMPGSVDTLAEFLSMAINDISIRGKSHIGEYYLLPHCTEQAICPNDARLWQDIFSKFNLVCKVTNLGCCGMAGSYGHEVKNEQNSKQLFAMHWQDTIIDKSRYYMATGYSCRSQAKSLADIELKHPIQILIEHM